MKQFLAKTMNAIQMMVQNKTLLLLFAFIFGFTVEMFAEGASAGIGAFQQVSQEIGSYIPYVKGVIYAIAGVIAVVGCISVFFKMNNEDNDVKKSIMMIIGACIFLVAAAEALPMFFGY